MAAADMNSQAFWNDFMRRPEVREAYQADKKLQMKKTAWKEARAEIEEFGERRMTLADALEEAPADIKKLVAPIFHIRVVEQFLWSVYDDCKKNKGNFAEQLREERYLGQLTKLRENFQEGGEARMEEIEKEWSAVCDEIAKDEEAKKVVEPVRPDMQTLKHVLEFGQECKIQGNLKFREGLYEEALEIYSQGDEMMKKFKVDKHMKNEHKWLKDEHLACLKNKSQAALKLEKFSMALEAANSALELDVEDHKAWYRKVQAEKGMGRFEDAEESLNRLEDVAKWNPDRRRILRDCEAERNRIRAAKIKHKEGTKEMLGKAFEAGVFSLDRQREQELEDKVGGDPAAKVENTDVPKKAIEQLKPLERNITLTAAHAGDLIDELADAYAQSAFQERVRKCARDSGFQRQIFLIRLKSIAFEVQKPILQKWGFEGSDHGVREMTAAIRDHVGRKDGKEMPAWLKEKQDRCLKTLYGGEEGGMLGIIGL